MTKTNLITVAPDTEPPLITSFTLPSKASNLTVTGVTLAASDNSQAISGFFLSESPAKPDAGAIGWTLPAPAQYTFASAGTKILYAWAKDAAGNVSDYATASVDVSLPVLLAPTVGAPSKSILKPGDSVTFSVGYSGAESVTLNAGSVTLNKTGTANGTAAVAGSGSSTRTVTITNITGDGTLGISIAAGSASASGGSITAAASAASATFTVDSTAPTLFVAALADSTATSNNTLTVSGSASDLNGIAGVTVNGTPVTLTGGAFNTALTLTAGSNTVTVVATDTAGNQKTDTRTIDYDNTLPVVTFSAPTPADGSFTGSASATVAGTVSKPGSVALTVNAGTPVVATLTGANNGFSVAINLAPGANAISVLASDGDTPPNSSTVYRTVTYDNSAPVLAISDPGQDISTSTGSYLVKGSVSDNYAGSTVSVAVDGVALSPAPAVGADGSFQQNIVFSAAKTYSVTVTATDRAGNAATVQRNFVYSPASSAGIDLGSASGVRGKTVTIPVTLTEAAGAQLSTLRVDIGYDPTLLLNPKAVLGAAGGAAGKTLDSSTPATGVFRVSLYDTGNAVLGNGILANVTFSVAASATIGTGIALSDTPQASDPAGNDLPVTGAGGTVSVIALPGDCNGDNGVTPGEFTNAINVFMGRAPGTSCVGFYGGVTVTPGYFTKVINAFMGR